MSELEVLAQKMDMSEITLSVSLPSQRFYANLNYKIKEDSHSDTGECQAFWSKALNIDSGLSHAAI